MANPNAAAYAAAYKALNHEQKQAVDQLEGPLLVIAGPGTGKTQLLATRIGRILERTDTAPENILCLTFSESAVRAMKQRLVSLIGPEAARNVNVSTYHGFGNSLITDYPERFNASALNARAADDLVLDQLIRQLQAKLPYSNLLKDDYYRKDIKSLISSYKRALITPEVLEQVLTLNQAFIDEANDLVNQILPDKFRLTKSSAKLFEQLYEESLSLPDKHIGVVVSLKKLWLEQLEAALAEAEHQESTTPIRQWKDKWLEKDEAGHFIVVSPKMMRKQLAFVEVFRRYNALLSKKELFDYDDMILLAIKGLSTNADLRQTLQERYLYIQLDEFQDTNEAQLKLVELLADHPVNEGRPNILAVGDDDQAIYSFQGAHYSHMERFYKNYKDVRLIGLKQNYRSTAGIIKLSENIRLQVNDGLKLLPKHQVSALPSSVKESIERVESPKDVEQLAWVSQQIKTLVKNGTKANEIAVFAPKHDLLIDLIPFLHANGIALNYEQKNNVLEDPKINQLLTAAKLALALDDPREADPLWPQVLSHDYWQLPTSLIWQISLKAAKEHLPWSEVLISNSETQAIAYFFMRLNQIATDTSFELMLSYLLGNLELTINEKGSNSMISPFYNYYFSDLSDQSKPISANSWRLLGQLTTLRAKARESSEQGLNLKQFIEFTNSYQQAELSIIDSSPFREGEDAVNLMTAHAAKGQEFDTVILIDLIDSVWGRSAKRGNAKIVLPFNLAHVSMNNNSDEEKLRLLFVALSRAKRRLILTSYAESLTGRVSEPVTYLGEQLRDKELLSLLLPKANQLVRRIKPTALKLDSVAPTWWDRHLDNFEAERAALLSDRLANFSISSTNLNAFTNVMDGGPRTFFTNEILKFPKAQTPRAQYGSAIHLTLDWLFKQTKQRGGRVIKLDQILKQFEELLAQRRLESNDFKQLLKQGKLSLSAFLEQLPFIVGPDDQSEYSFNPSLGENNIHLKGTIDRLIVDSKNHQISIIDYKSGKSYTKWNLSKIKPFHHQRQLYFYKLLIEQTPKFKGYTVNNASIQFVEPDEEGRIKSINLTFDQNEADKLLLIINAVWDKVIKLNFPATDHYAQNVKGIKAFEQDLIEGKVK